MTTRLVVGIVSRTDGTPWQNTKVIFRRCQGTYTSTNQYPPDTIIAYTNQDGELYSVIGNGNVLVSGVYLWCNAEGASYTPYECQLPNDLFTFKLSVGDTPISLSALREGSSNSTQPQYESLLDYIDTSVENAISKVQLDSTKIFSDNFVATSPLSALRIVNLSTGTYASNIDINDINGTFGLNIQSINQNSTNKLLIYGQHTDNNWNWDNSLIYLGVNGLLTQNLIGNEKFILKIGSVIKNDTIFIDIDEVIECI